MNYLLLLILILLPVNLNATVLWEHTAETTPICSQTASSTYDLNECQAQITRVQEITPIRGSWHLKSNVTVPGDNQTGKAIRYLGEWTGLPGTSSPPLTDGYFSAWYYFPSTSAYGTSWPKYGNWTNHFQFKTENYPSEQDSPYVDGGPLPKFIINMNYVNGVRRWMLTIRSAKFSANGGDFPIGYFPHNIAGETGKWANTSFTVPLNEWVYLEARVKMTETNGILQVWTGTASEGVLHLLYDMSDPDLNMLTTWNSSAGSYSSNWHMYFAFGSYVDTGLPAGNYTLYMDDIRVATHFVGPTLTEFDNPEPPPPTDLTVQARARIHGLRGTEAAPVIKAGTNSPYGVQPGGSFRLRLELTCTTNCPNITLPLHRSKNGGAYTAVTDSFSSGVAYYGTAASIEVPSDNTATTEIYTDSPLTFQAGKIIRQASSVPTWVCNGSTNCKTEMEYIIKFDNTVVKDDTFDFKVDGIEHLQVVPRVNIKYSEFQM